MKEERSDVLGLPGGVLRLSVYQLVICYVRAFGCGLDSYVRVLGVGYISTKFD